MAAVEFTERPIMEVKHKKLVVDTNAVLRNVHFENMAEEIYTVPEVIAEIRDKQTRSSIVSTTILPATAHIQDPDPKYIRRVTEMARKTGDISVLSDPDIKVISLTLSLFEDLKATEEEKAEEAPKKVKKGGNPEGEWVTPENYRRVRSEIQNGNDIDEVKPVSVGCLTGDFAMQNVLITLGLNVVSFDGLRIREARTFALKCFSCFEIIRNTTKVFCPKCGNSTLRRVQVKTTKDNGLVEIETRNSRRQQSLRGTVYTIPKPKGGKQSNKDPVLTEDELQHRLKTMPKPKGDDISAAVAVNPFGIESGGNGGKKLSVAQQRRLAGVSGRNPNVPRKPIGKKNKPKPVEYF